MLIVTEWCVIREFENKDIDSFMEYRNDCDWMQYQGFKGLSKEEYEKALLETSSINDGMQFAITDKNIGCLLGDIYLRQNNSTFELGYTINPNMLDKVMQQKLLVALSIGANNKVQN